MATELDEGDVETVFSKFITYERDEAKVEVEIDGGQRTVDVRPVYDFERDLVDDIIGETVNGELAGSAIPIKGRWIYGWLEEQGEDYINSIWKGYQFFLRYAEVVTSDVENMSTFQRPPGTYDSMYRYILMLEDLELLDRFKNVEVDEDVYDFNVPVEFRNRTYVRNTANYEDNKFAWNNPIEALYNYESPVESSGEDITEETPETDTDDDMSTEELLDIIDESESEDGADEYIIDDDTDTADIDATDTDTETGSASDFIVDDEQGETDDSTETTEDITIMDLDVSEVYNLPEEDTSITDFEDKDLIPKFIQTQFSDAVEEAFDQASIVGQDIEPSDITLGRVAVTGPWANDNATPGQTPLTVFIEINNESSGMNVGFLPGSVNRILSEKLNQYNVFGQDVFPSYKVDSAYSESYRSQLKRHVQTDQVGMEYYDYSSGELKEVQ